MIVLEKNLKSVSSNTYQLVGQRLKEKLKSGANALFDEELETEKPFCDSVKYLDQKSYGFCSGFLIAPKLFITAGHCVSNKEVGFFRDSKTKSSYLENMRVVFNVNNNNRSTIFHKKNIYSIKQIKRFKNLGERGDYALLELSDDVRVSASVAPLASALLDKEDELKRNDELVVIGHPYGLPLKISSDAKIMQKSGAVFYANIDAFPGSSGSMVVNRRTNKVVGILVGGPSDQILEFNSEENCIEHKTLSETPKDKAELSSVTKISNVLIKNKDLTQNFFDTLMVLHKYYEEYRGGDALYAKKAKDYSKLEKLFEKLDYDVDLEDEKGETPLYKAIELQNFEMFKFFLKKNDNINKLFKGKPYSLLVLETKNSEFIKYTLSLNIIDFSRKYQGQTIEKYYNSCLISQQCSSYNQIP